MLILYRAGCLLGASLWVMNPTAHAETAAGAETPGGAEIVVQGRGLDETPATPAYDVQRIERDQINASASGRIEDVLSSVAGFQQFRRSDSRSANPSAQGVTLRALGGNATSRALVLLDGVPLADPMFGYIPLSALAPERLSAIRVTRGGGSGAFGAGAVAGTIELESADANQLGLFSGSALANDRGDTELSATVAPKLGEGFVVASARWDRGEGFWTTPESQRVPASVKARYGSWSAGLRAVAPLTGDVELQASVRAFEDHRTLRFAGADSSSSGQDASVRLVGRGAWQFDALAYVQLRDFSNVVISSTSFLKTLDQRRTPSTGLGGKLEVRPPIGGGHVLRLGGDWRLARGELQEEAYNPAGAVTTRRRAGGRNSDIGLFAQDDWRVGPVVLTAGVRADRWTIDDGFIREVGATTTNTLFPNRAGWDTSLRGGAVWRVTPRLAVRAAGYSGIRLPTLNELYRPFVVFPITTRANAALGNEHLVGFEGGIDWTPSAATTISLTAFDNRIENAIANVTIATNVRERRNVDAIHARGIELSAGLKLGRWSLDGSLALTDAEVESSGTSASLNGLRPAQTPKIAASLTAGWRPRDGWLVAATLRHVGAQFEDDLQTDVLPPATTLDMFAQVPLSPRVSVILRGENLTDTDIVTRNQGGSIDLGTPRTVWAGIRVKLPH
ncbi:MAG: TonB-dependent receptor [Novosphingobium sp.]|nr:TonB-dependent receptor [Novosphingobium sp.]